MIIVIIIFFFFSSRRRHTRYWRDWSSDVCSSDLARPRASIPPGEAETVQRLVQKEIAGLLATHRAEIDLEYRLKRYRELASRFRALRAEEADVQEADGRIEPAAAAPPHAERGIGPPRRPTCGRHRPPISQAPKGRRSVAFSFDDGSQNRRCRRPVELKGGRARDAGGAGGDRWPPAPETTPSAPALTTPSDRTPDTPDGDFTTTDARAARAARTRLAEAEAPRPVLPLEADGAAGRIPGAVPARPDGRGRHPLPKGPHPGGGPRGRAAGAGGVGRDG